ncbi:glycosyl transferase group 1 [Thalassoporum mexicanum PCC 7367]|uniref:glycosyltransferase family 4 protein n=1 Tax=Thalassoporum mexicanum TaxID=3457544 RepID=UPI00029FCE04|nr:glycosyltransferase family 4 protein [Pseudanabaena sp. PCC 7367]AFY71747.1 glycosyl transferase group 1 [Pseudanabaena sp. PCC 7367]
MHIAWLGKKTPVCGNVTYGREITNALLDRGHRVSFLHFASDTESMAHGNNSSNTHHSQNHAVPNGGAIVDRQDVPLPFLYKSTIFTVPSLSASKILVESLRELKPDLVHASLALSPLDFMLPEICADLNLPLLATFHLPFDLKRRNITSSTQQFTYQIYAPSLADYHQVIIFSQVQRDLLKKLGVPDSRISIIPNGVDPDRYSPGTSNIKAELGAEHLFVYQGRLALEKNVEAMLRAWRKLKLPDTCKLAIVGDGPSGTTLKSTYGSDSNIVWMGFIADEKRRIEILRGADGFILPSLVEGLSLSLLEAMSCGVACLATDVGADGEVLANGAGIVLDPRKVTSQLVNFLPLLITHPEFAKLLGKKARQRVLEKYTLNKNITILEDLYRQVLKKPQVSYIN